MVRTRSRTVLGGSFWRTAESGSKADVPFFLKEEEEEEEEMEMEIEY